MRAEVALSAVSLDSPFSLLEKLSKDESSYVRLAVFNALNSLNPEGVFSVEGFEGWSLLNKILMKKSGPGEFDFQIEEDILDNLYLHPYSEARKNAVRAIAHVWGGETGLGLLANVSTDSDPYVREAVAFSVGEMIGNLSRDSDLYVEEIVDSAFGIKALNLLGELSKDSNFNVRRAVVSPAGELGEKALPLLYKLSQDRNFHVRRAVVSSAGELGKKALPLLHKLSQDRTFSIRRAVARSASELGEKALPLLLELSENKDPYIKTHVITRTIEKLSTDSDPDVKEIFGRKLEKLSTDNDPYTKEQVLLLLEKLSTNNDPEFRSIAIRSAIELGLTGFPILKKMLSMESASSEKIVGAVFMIHLMSPLKMRQKLPLLEKLARDKETQKIFFENSMGPLSRFVMSNTKDLFVLEELAEKMEELLISNDSDLKERIAYYAGILGVRNLGLLKKMLSLLEKLSKDNSPRVRREVFNALLNILTEKDLPLDNEFVTVFKKKALPLMKRLVKDKDPLVRRSFLEYHLSNSSEKLIPYLKNLGEEAYPLLKELEIKKDR